MPRHFRIILDTNWYISATINRVSRRKLYNLLTNEYLTICYCDDLVNEYKNVISREKFKKYVRQEQVKRFLTLTLSRLTSVDIKSNIIGSKDVKDNYLLSLSVDANADYLVTGDPDLLLLDKIGQTIILNMANFLVLL